MFSSIFPEPFARGLGKIDGFVARYPGDVLEIVGTKIDGCVGVMFWATVGGFVGARVGKDRRLRGEMFRSIFWGPWAAALARDREMFL